MIIILCFQPYRHMPFFDTVFLDSIKYNDIYLASDIK